MVKERNRGRLQRALVLAAALGLLFAACSNSDDDDSAGSATDGGGASGGVPGVTDAEIRVAALGTNSNNPLGTCVLDCFVDGIEAYFDYRNSEGGVHGRQLVVSDVVDDELANNQAKALEIISANDTFATFTATQIPSGWADLANAGIPTYTWAIHPQAASGHDEIFGNAPVVCIDCTSRGFAYAVQLTGGTTVASLGYGVSENSKVCAQTNAETVAAYSGEIGGATVAYTNENLAFGLPNGIGPEVTAMKDAGVDVIMACIDLNGMKTLAQELERQGIRDQVTMIHPNTYDQGFVANAGGLFDGDFVSVGFRPFEADAAGSQLTHYREWMANAGSRETELAMQGWINADLFYQSLLGAGPDFARASVIAAGNQLTNFTAGGLVPPIDWSRQHVPPTQDDLATHGPKDDCVAIVEIVDGQFQVVGDPAAPWACWSGANRDWAEPAPMNFQ